MGRVIVVIVGEVGRARLGMDWTWTFASALFVVVAYRKDRMMISVVIVVEGKD